MKRYISLLLLLPLLCSCGTNTYTESLSCSEITSSLTSDLMTSQPYSEYSVEDVVLSFGNAELYDSCSVIYSTSSDDIDEVGVFHAKSSADQKKLYASTVKYIEDIKSDKEEFLRNYIPSELEKLRGAQVREFGNYVVYTLLSPKESKQVFSLLERLLKK